MTVFLQKVAEIKENAAASLAAAEQRHLEEAGVLRRRLEESAGQSHLLQSRVDELEKHSTLSVAESSRQTAKIVEDFEVRIANLVYLQFDLMRFR